MTPAFVCALTVFAPGRSSAAAFPSASSDHHCHHLLPRGRRQGLPQHLLPRGRRQGSPQHSGAGNIKSIENVCFRGIFSSPASSVDGTSPDESQGVIDVSRGGGAGGGSLLDRGLEFASKNFFLLGMATAVSMARLAPSLGKNGSILRPEIFFGQYGVSAIFALSGLSLAFGELQNAFENIKL